MPKCEFSEFSVIYSWKLTLSASDGKTPEEQTRQILGIVAILPGQSPKRRFSIPQRKSTEKVATRNSLNMTTNDAPRSPTSAAAPPNGAIVEQNPTKPVTARRPHAVSAADTTERPIQMEPSNGPSSLLKQAASGLANKMQELKVGDENVNLNKPLPAAPKDDDPTPGIKRQDSETGDIDEFQDAEAAL